MTEWEEYQQMLADEIAAQPPNLKSVVAVKETERANEKPEDKIVRAINYLAVAFSAIPRTQDDKGYEVMAKQIEGLVRVLSLKMNPPVPIEKPKTPSRWTFRVNRNEKGNIETIEAERIEA